MLTYNKKVLQTLNKRSHFADFEQVKKLNSHFTDFKQIICQKLHSLGDLGDAMPCHWSLCFLVSPCYKMLCHTARATDLRERFLCSGVFYLALLPAIFKGSLGQAVRPKSSATELYSK